MWNTVVYLNIFRVAIYLNFNLNIHLDTNEWRCWYCVLELTEVLDGCVVTFAGTSFICIMNGTFLHHFWHNYDVIFSPVMSNKKSSCTEKSVFSSRAWKEESKHSMPLGILFHDRLVEGGE